MNLSWHNADEVWFRHAWRTFTGVIALSKIYFSKLFHAVCWDFDLNQNKFQFISFVGVMPLKYLLGPVGDMYCLSNTFRMLVFSGFMGNELECGTNKTCELRSGSPAICLFHSTIHSPWTQKKRHSFLIFTLLPKRPFLKFSEKSYKFKIPAVTGT